MTILCCTDEPIEMELSGTPVELRAMRDEIDAFAKSQEQSGAIALAVLTDPTPYARSVATLVLTRANGPTRVSILPDGNVQVAGSADNLRLFAEWLDFEDDVPENYHVHYEGWPGNEHIAEDSVGLVISVKR